MILGENLRDDRRGNPNKNFREIAMRTFKYALLVVGILGLYVDLKHR